MFAQCDYFYYIEAVYLSTVLCTYTPDMVDNNTIHDSIHNLSFACVFGHSSKCTPPVLLLQVVYQHNSPKMYDYTKITEVNLSAFAYRLFREDFPLLFRTMYNYNYLYKKSSIFTHSAHATVQPNPINSSSSILYSVIIVIAVLLC